MRFTAQSIKIACLAGASWQSVTAIASLSPALKTSAEAAAEFNAKMLEASMAVQEFSLIANVCAKPRRRRHAHGGLRPLVSRKIVWGRRTTSC